MIVVFKIFLISFLSAILKFFFGNETSTNLIMITKPIIPIKKEIIKLFFASFGQTFYIALFNTHLRSAYNLTDGEFGLVYATATILSSLVFISFAKLIDRIDLRIYSAIIILGLAFACLGFYLLLKILCAFLAPFSAIFIKSSSTSVPKSPTTNPTLSIASSNEADISCPLGFLSFVWGAETASDYPQRLFYSSIC